MSTGLKQVCTDDNYVYVATTSGLDVISLSTENRVNFISSVEGYNTVWASDAYLYVGSSTNGVEVIDKNYVTTTGIEPTAYENFPFLSSDNVLYIHGNDTRIIACTDAGVDIIRTDSHYVTNNTAVTTAKKCFVTPDHSYYYYLVSGTGNYQIHRLNSNTSDWTTPDIIYTTGSGFLSDATIINDFYVTEHTSIVDNDNTLFIATVSGVYVYDEGTTDYLLFTTVS